MKELKKITFLLPTCEPDEMFKWLLPSLKNIQLAKDYINFAICFQPPYTEEEINKVINELNILGFEYKYFYKDYKVVKPYTPLIKMRNDCAMLYPDSLVYGLLDDDISFESNICAGDLIRVLDTFIFNQHIGVIAFKDCNRGMFVFNCFATDCGIFYRGGVSYGFKGLMPENLYEFKNIKEIIPNYEGENLLNLFGGYQDKFCANVRLFNGSHALIFNNVTIHHVENRKARGAIGHGWIKAQDLEGSIAQFIIKYYNKNFLRDNSMSLYDERFEDMLYSNTEKYSNITYPYMIYDKLKNSTTFNNPLINKDYYLNEIEKLDINKINITNTLGINYFKEQENKLLEDYKTMSLE